MRYEENGASLPREGIDEDFLRRIIEEGESDGGRTSCRMGERARMSRRGNRYPDVPAAAVPQDDTPSDCGYPGAGENEDTVGWGLMGYPLATVYAPVQCFRNLYETEAGWRRGTIFSELDLPLGGYTTSKGGCCRG